MPKKKVFSKEAWIRDRGYTEEYAERFAFFPKCFGLTAEEIEEKYGILLQGLVYAPCYVEVDE